MKRKAQPSLSDDENKIAERLKQTREQLGLSQAALAAKAKLSRSAVVHYENGNAIPGAKELIKLAKALQRTPNYFLSGDDTFFPSAKTEHLLIGNNPLLTALKIAVCVNVLDRDVTENVSALLMGLVRAKLTADQFANLLTEIQKLEGPLSEALPDINTFADDAVKTLTGSKPKPSPRPRAKR